MKAQKIQLYCKKTLKFPQRCSILYKITSGRLAQLVRASRLHRECRGFESLIAHHFCLRQKW